MTRLVFLLAAATVIAGGATAEECPAIRGGGPELARLDSGVRLRFLQAHLRAEAHRARVWTWGWGLGYGALTAGQLAPLPFLQPSDRIDFAIGAGSSAVGLGFLLLFPLQVMSDSGALDARLSSGADPPSCAQLALGEDALLADADDEASGRSWLMHVANALFNVGVGLVLGVGFGHWQSAVINTVGGELIGEAMILTQPAGLLEARRRYRAGETDGPAPAEAHAWALVPMLGPDHSVALTWMAHF